MPTHLLTESREGQTLDVHYFDAADCLTEWIVSRSDSEEIDEGTMALDDGTTLEYGAWPCPDWPDDAVYCATCGDLMHRPPYEVPTIYTLARMAEVSDPDSDESPGGRFLLRVAEEAAGCIDEDGELAEDEVGERADALVPVYTYDRWRTFVDLGAWSEDLTDLGPVPDDLTEAAGVALYLIAERLLRAVAEDATA